MSLVCCLDPAANCACEQNQICGGIHVISSGCPVHARAEFKSTVHEVGQKRTTDIKPLQEVL